MEYDYEDEPWLPGYISSINLTIRDQEDNERHELVFSEITGVTLKDLSTAIIPAVENFDPIYVCIHRFGIGYRGTRRGKYMNVVTFHSKNITSQELGVYYPDNVELTYDENTIKTEMKYLLEEDNKELLQYLTQLDYYSWFDNKYREKILQAMEHDGIEVEVYNTGDMIEINNASL